MDEIRNYIAPRGHALADYTSLESWVFGEQGSNDLQVAVLQNDQRSVLELVKFQEQETYRHARFEFVLIAESGSVVASYLDDAWELVSPDIASVLAQSEKSTDVQMRAVRTYLAERFGHDLSETAASEIRTLFDRFLAELAKLVSLQPETLDRIEWRDLERLLATVLEGLGFNVELTPSSKDGGKDIVVSCRISARTFTYFVEVKHWRSRKRVGPTVLTDFLRVLVREQQDAGLLLSTYGYSAPALELLAEVDRERLRIGDKEKMVSLCKTYTKLQSGLALPSEVLPLLLFDGTA